MSYFDITNMYLIPQFFLQNAHMMLDINQHHMRICFNDLWLMRTFYF
jgi:hypothetical protein